MMKLKNGLNYMQQLDRGNQMSVKKSLQVLQDIESAQGTNSKNKILKDNRDLEPLSTILFATYGGDTFGSNISLEFDDITENISNLQDEVLEENWIKFKSILISLRDRQITGHKAIATLDEFIKSISKLEAKWYRRITEHDLKININNRSLSKIWDFKSMSLEGKKDIQGIQFPGVMLCDDDSKRITKWSKLEYLVEPKLDGLRLVFVYKDNNWSFFSRSGKNKSYNDNLSHIAESLIKLLNKSGYNEGIIDGEILGETWNSTLVIKKKIFSEQDIEQLKKVNFHVFDHLLSPKDNRPQNERRKSLEQIIIPEENDKIILVKQHNVNSIQDIHTLFDEYVSKGLEGIIVKEPSTTYSFDNKRSKSWIKMKPVDSLDVKVIGYFEGEERTKNENRLGGFITIDPNTQKEIRIGSGYTDLQREEFWNNKDQYINKWMEIAYQKDGVAVGRFPRFVRWRLDID